jgi:hypothetical protein
MNVFVDTSVWSLAFRRDQPSTDPSVESLARCLRAGDLIFTTGLVLQELLQGFDGPKAKEAILSKFDRLPTIVPTTTDHVLAAELRNTCRRKGIQIGTIDALIAHLCINNELQLLTTDQDFHHVAQNTHLSLLV